MAAGKRVVVVSGADYGEEMAPLVFARGNATCAWAEPHLHQLQGPPNCTVAGAPPRRAATRLLAPLLRQGAPRAAAARRRCSRSGRAALTRSLLLLPPPSLAAGKDGEERRTSAGRLLRMTGCEILYGPLNCDFEWGPNTGVLEEGVLGELAACGVNMPSPDNITPARMGAFVWSWAEGQPAGGLQQREGPAAAVVRRLAAAGGAGGQGDSSSGSSSSGGGPSANRWAVLNATDGRWYAAAAFGGEGEAAQLPAACRRAGAAACAGWGEGGAAASKPLWALGEAGAEQGSGQRDGGWGCPPGYAFDLPRCPAENLQLRQLLAGRGVAGAALALQPPDYLPAWL